MAPDLRLIEVLTRHGVPFVVVSGHRSLRPRGPGCFVSSTLAIGAVLERQPPRMEAHRRICRRERLTIAQFHLGQIDGIADDGMPRPPGTVSSAIQLAIVATGLGIKNLERVADMLIPATIHPGEPFDDLSELYHGTSPLATGEPFVRRHAVMAH